MNIEQIKAQLAIPTLQLNASLGADKQPDGWLRHWENDTRTAVSIHKETFEEIKKNPAMDNLGIQEESRTGAKGEYQALRIVAYTPAEFTL